MAAALSQRVSDRSAMVAGVGRLVVESSGRRSVVTRAYAASPLKLLTPANHGHAAWVYSSTYGGGLVDGDAIAFDVEVGERASLFLSTQASTKVYRSPGGTSVRTHACVLGDGVLVSAPDPTVCFAGARYRQTQEIDLEARGSVVLVEWMTSGRRASGERWAFDAYESRLVLRIDGQCVVYDGLRLAGDDGELGGRLGNVNVLATVLLAGPRVTEHARATHAAIVASPVVRRPDPLVTAATIGDAGCLVRIAGRDVETVARTIAGLLSFVPALLGDDPWRRKW